MHEHHGKLNRVKENFFTELKEINKGLSQEEKENQALSKEQIQEILNSDDKIPLNVIRGNFHKAFPGQLGKFASGKGSKVYSIEPCCGSGL